MEVVLSTQLLRSMMVWHHRS